MQIPIPGRTPPIQVTGGPALTGRRGVPLFVPLSFLYTGAIALTIFGLAAPFTLPQAIISPFFPHVLATVHTITLGWLTMTIMGASYQLIPVIVVSPLRAERFIAWQFPLYLIGVATLITGFWIMQPIVIATGGSLVIIAALHHSMVLLTTIAASATRPLTARYLITSLLYLLLVTSLGVIAAINLQTGFLGSATNQILLTHLTLGIIGWLTTTLIGVSYTLIKLFGLIHNHNERIGRSIFFTLNGSILTIGLGALLQWKLFIIIGGITLIATAWLYAYDVWLMFTHRQRKNLEVTQYHTIASVAYLAITTPLALWTATQQAYLPRQFFTAGLLLLAGWVGQSVLGFLYKIIPFLVWHARYGPLVGKHKVPVMKDLVHIRMAWGSFWLTNGGIVASGIAALSGNALAVSMTLGVLGIGLLMVGINVTGIVRHLRWSDLQK